MPNSDSPLRREEWSRGARGGLKQTAGGPCDGLSGHLASQHVIRSFHVDVVW